MIAVPPVTTASLSTLRACDLLERAARWGASLALMIPAAGAGGPEVGKRLRGRLDQVATRLARVWPELARILEDGDLPEPQAAALALACDGAAAEIGHLERALRKLPGLPVRTEVYELLAELAGPGEPVPPVILVPEDQDLDDDGFLALPAAQAAAPLAWPRLAFGLAAATAGGPPADLPATIRLDLVAAGRVGPAYLFALLERGVQGGFVGFADRVRAVGADLSARGLLVRELADLLGTLGFSVDGLAVAPDDQEPFAAARLAASRLADGILASARPTADREAIRAAREQLLADPQGGAEAVYAALAGLREEPLTSATILTGAWLFRERARPGWLRDALAAPDPMEAYGREILQLDALVLKSLETASVHRQLGARA